MTTDEIKRANIKEMEKSNLKIMILSGYCRCTQCGHWHNLNNTSSRNWLDGVCSDKCNKEAPDLDKRPYKDWDKEIYK